MSLPAVFDPQGKPIRLGKLVKSGGAGSVYLCASHPDSVVKLYHAKVDTQMYARKLQAMLQLCPRLPAQTIGGKKHVQIAWPQQTVHDAKGVFIGFMMPMLDIAATSDLEHMMNERQARAAKLPVSLGARITLAANLTRVLAQLHQRGHHVVDLKPLNLRFYRESLLIALLDCDGFSIHSEREHFPAQQYTPDYLAPEFQGKGVVPAGKEEQQDRFALAVIVFQLMNFGIHPYSGRPKSSRAPTDLPGRIGKHLYAYGQQPNHKIAPVPLSGHETWPKALRQMFDRAFAARGTRPSAADWAKILERYALRDGGDLQVCGKNRTHQHFAGMPCAACARHDALENVKKQQAAVKPRGNRKRANPRQPVVVVPSIVAQTSVQQQYNTQNVVVQMSLQQHSIQSVAAQTVIQQQYSIPIPGPLLASSIWGVLMGVVILGFIGFFGSAAAHVFIPEVTGKNIFLALISLFVLLTTLPASWFAMRTASGLLMKNISQASGWRKNAYSAIALFILISSAYWLGGLGISGIGGVSRGLRAGFMFAGVMVLVDFLYSLWVNKGFKYQAVKFFLIASFVAWFAVAFASLVFRNSNGEPVPVMEESPASIPVVPEKLEDVMSRVLREAAYGEDFTASLQVLKENKIRSRVASSPEEIFYIFQDIEKIRQIKERMDVIMESRGATYEEKQQAMAEWLMALQDMRGNSDARHHLLTEHELVILSAYFWYQSAELWKKSEEPNVPSAAMLESNRLMEASRAMLEQLVYMNPESGWRWRIYSKVLYANHHLLADGAKRLAGKLRFNIDDYYIEGNVGGWMMSEFHSSGNVLYMHIFLGDFIVDHPVLQEKEMCNIDSSGTVPVSVVPVEANEQTLPALPEN